MPTDDSEQWDDPAGLEPDADSASSPSAAGLIVGVIATAVVLYFLWLGAHTEAVLALWGLVALAGVRMLVNGLRGGR